VINNVAIIYKHTIKEAVVLSQELTSLLKSLGKTVWLAKVSSLDRRAKNVPPFDLVVTLGGDGTILRAARLAAPQQALVLGVNLGQLGFLAELGPADALNQLPIVLNGGGWIEERMMLRCVVRSDGQPSPPIDGLNDAILGRGERPRAVRVSVSVDGQHLQTYVADGVIVSTPTGSTAYALAMDGPIVCPELRTLQITPVAPHLAVIRSMVIPPTARVELVVHTNETAVAAIDGQVEVPLKDGDVVEVTTSPYVARFVRLQPHNYFYQTLVNRLSTTIVRGLL